MKAFIFWDTTSQTKNRRYWAIAEYHDKGPWLFYWHEGNENWVTMKSVDNQFIEDTKVDPRSEELTREKWPLFFEAFDAIDIAA